MEQRRIFSVTVAVLLMVLLAGCGSDNNTPSAPQNLTAAAGASMVTLDWDAVTDATSYNVYRSLSTGDLSSKVLLVSALTATAYSDTNVTSGTTYFYQVTAENSDGESNGSAEVQATPQ
jgi:fibronectin type 3 domain-containing protein